MNKLKQVLLLIGVAYLSGCVASSNHMNAVGDEKSKLVPEQGKALVVFARTSNFGGAIQATLFDDDAYIGTISAKTKVAYQAAPGKHMFMVIGESADFMEADLEAGKTYYAGVLARMGLWKARFSLHPNNKQISDTELANWMADTKLVEANGEGLKWAKDNQASITSKRAEYLPDWHAKAEKDKQRLLKDSGY